MSNTAYFMAHESPQPLAWGDETAPLCERGPNYSVPLLWLASFGPEHLASQPVECVDDAGKELVADYSVLFAPRYEALARCLQALETQDPDDLAELFVQAGAEFDAGTLSATFDPDDLEFCLLGYFAEEPG